MNSKYCGAKIQCVDKMRLNYAVQIQIFEEKCIISELLSTNISHRIMSHSYNLCSCIDNTLYG